jgi:nucleoside-diphosphate-sugar epimerase
MKEICLVTGGAGFIGSHISETLVKQGKKVRILDNLSAGKMEHIAGFKKSVEFIKGDVRSLKDCRRAVKGADYVFHSAAMRSVPKSVDRPFDAHENNATGTLNLLVASKDAKVKRLVYASTSSAYGDCEKFPQKEEYKPEPVSPYAASKLAAEHYCVLFTKTYGLPTVSLRYFNVFGPRQDPESLYSVVVPKFMERAWMKKPLEVHWDGKQSRDFTHIKNVVQANLLAAFSKNGAGEVFNIANGAAYSLLDLIRVIEKIVGRKLEVKYFPKRQGDVRKTCADISRAKRILGYKPEMNFEEGLKDTWNYFAETYFRN